jgi:hypothetical protein
MIGNGPLYQALSKSANGDMALTLGTTNARSVTKQPHRRLPMLSF